MMKKLLCLLMMVCLLLPSPVSATKASAEVSAPALQWGQSMEDAFCDYWTGLGIKAEFYFDVNWRSLLDILTGSDPADGGTVYTNWEDMGALLSGAPLMDLSSSEVIRAYIARLRPFVREAVTTDDGRILALPSDARVNPLYWYEGPWLAAGLDPADVPQSYTELLDFLDAWAARKKTGADQKICIADTTLWNTGEAKYNYVYWLTDILMSTWEMQAYYAGVPLNYDTEELIALLKRTREVGIRLYKSEPHGRTRQKIPHLFQNGDDLFNQDVDYGLSHTVPFRITREQPALMRGEMIYSVGRADSPYAAEIIGSLEAIAEDTAADPRRHPALFADVDGGSFQVYSNSAETAQLHQGFVDDLNSYTGIIVCAPWRAFNYYTGSMLKFCKGELSTQKLVKKLNVEKRDPNE